MVSRRRRSRTPSAANYAQRDARRLASLVFFIDRNLGRNIIAPQLLAADAKVELHDDHFDQNMPDPDWLAVVGERGWVVITRDKFIRRNPLERAAFERAGVRGFVLTGGGLALAPSSAARSSSVAAVCTVSMVPWGPWLR